MGGGLNRPTLTYFAIILSLVPLAVVWWSGRKAGKGGSGSYDPFKTPPKLMTPKQIDAQAAESGLIECECAQLIQGIPVLGLVNPHVKKEREEGKQAVIAGDDEDKRGSKGDTEEKKVEEQGGGGRRERGDTWTGSLGSNEYQETMCYVREFLAKPHPDVGRRGPVCPFVPLSLKKNTLYLSVVRTPGGKVDRASMETMIKGFAESFNKLEPTTGKLRPYKAVILIFPDIAVEDAPDLIDGVQYACKGDFVSRGLMLGEFHLANNACGLRNPNFYPLRTPFPSLAIRHMVPTDFVFMKLDAYPLSTRVKFLESFLAVFGEETEKKEVVAAKEALVEAKAQLAKEEEKVQ